MTSEAFVERHETVRLRYGRAGFQEQILEHEAGLGLTRRHPGAVTYRWRALPDASAPLDELSVALAGRVRALLEPPPKLDQRVAHAERLLARLLAEAGPAGLPQLDVTLHEQRQQILVETEPAGIVSDTRHFTRLVLRAAPPQRTPAALSVLRTYVCAGPSCTEADLPRLAAVLADMRGALEGRAAAQPCPTGDLPVVLAPGATAHFFHEVVGHALEGDVVVPGTSYLAALRGQYIASPALTLVDDPLCPGSPAAYRIDDEGVPAQPTTLIAAGRVHEPLLDRSTAARAHSQSNGHGRRLNFRFGALPRQSHLEVQPDTGSLATLIAALPVGLLIRQLRPRHVDIASGAWSFYIDEAAMIRDGRRAEPIGPGLLVGDGPTALAQISAIGADRSAALGTGGCGKLDQGPLTVSFRQPSVRFERLSVVGHS